MLSILTDLFSGIRIYVIKHYILGQQQSRHIALVLLCRRAVIIHIHICIHIWRSQRFHLCVIHSGKQDVGTIQFVIVIPLNAISPNSQCLLAHL